jgi:hypothetical protein
VPSLAFLSTPFSYTGTAKKMLLDLLGWDVLARDEASNEVKDHEQ